MGNGFLLLYNLDMDEIVNMKMSQNEAKYPVDKSKGKAISMTGYSSIFRLIAGFFFFSQVFTICSRRKDRKPSVFPVLP